MRAICNYCKRDMPTSGGCLPIPVVHHGKAFGQIKADVVNRFPRGGTGRALRRLWQALRTLSSSRLRL
jgi:hypothetical protein